MRWSPCTGRCSGARAEPTAGQTSPPAPQLRDPRTCLWGSAHATPSPLPCLPCSPGLFSLENASSPSWLVSGLSPLARAPRRSPALIPSASAPLSSLGMHLLPRELRGEARGGLVFYSLRAQLLSQDQTYSRCSVNIPIEPSTRRLRRGSGFPASAFGQLGSGSGHV